MKISSVSQILLKKMKAETIVLQKYLQDGFLWYFTNNEAACARAEEKTIR